MSPVDDVRKYTDLSFPRVSGDEPSAGGVSVTAYEFSPRERG